MFSEEYLKVEWPEGDSVCSCTQMEFPNRKLPKSKAAELSVYSMESAEPYRPLPAPVYLFLPRNEKMVTVKGSFDFFTNADLERMKRGGMFYYGPTYRQVEPFLAAAREMQVMLGWNTPNATEVLEPAPYEISDAILRKLASLWTPLGVESHFAVAFTNELCEAVPEGFLESKRESDPDGYELSILRSGVFVFLALHLGYVDFRTLNAWRLRIFNGSDGAPFSEELGDLKKWVESVIHSPEIQTLESRHFEESTSRIAQKLKSRLFRIRNELMESEVRDVG